MNWREYRHKILTTIDTHAFYLDELKRMELAFSRHGNEIKSRCPFSHLHASGQDLSPSFTVNLDKGVYYCNACGSKGNIHTFYSSVYNTTRQETWYALGDALGLPRPRSTDSRPGIDPALPVKYHLALMKSTGTVRDILKDMRGISDKTLIDFQIGWDGDRITLPIYDEYNDLVNIRRYKWNSYEDNLKMINFVDEMENPYGEVRIYGIEHLYDKTVDEIVWCEGEWDRLIAEQNGLKACTATAGANNFRSEWFNLLAQKKQIYVAYDNDDAGRLASAFFIENLRRKTKLHEIVWPEGFYDKGDVTDIFVKDNISVANFLALFREIEPEADIADVQLATSSDARYTGKRLKMPVLVVGKESAPYVFPAKVTMHCQEGSDDNKLCASCSLFYKKRIDVDLDSKNPLILKVVDVPDDTQRLVLKKTVGMNDKCPLGVLEIKEYKNLETIHMIPKADMGTGFALRQEYVARSGYMIGNNLPTNKKYGIVGYMHANPRTQKATYIFDKAIPEKDILDELEVTPEIYEKLKIFQCAEGQSIEEKFNEIHQDLERNVTYIWERRKVAFAVDLVYHTALSFMFQEQQVKRGWAECLIIGDSGQAKTTLVERLMHHYRAGELFSGESSKRTGLVYNLQQTGSRGQWSLMWGAMPLNDGGLLTLDELSGMPEDDLARMSDVRSSGIAKATGVVTGETTARTRMIFISNPRNGRQLKAEQYGVHAVLKLFGKAEDVRRLDFALAVASGEVDAALVNKSIADMPRIEHKYTSDLCHLRIMWAWSRRPENVKFTDEASEAILKAAADMGTKYSSRIPLVEPADQRLKIARLSVSAAAAVYSTDTEGTDVIVKPEHVEFIVTYLNSIYGSKALGYDRFSIDDFENSDTTSGALLKLRNILIAIPFASRDLMEVVRALYQLPYLNRNSLEDATGLDRDEIKNLMHFLISNSIIEKASMTDYKRTPLGLAFIESILLDPPTHDEIIEARKKYFMNAEI